MAQAYLMMGKTDQGREALQAAIYQHLIALEGNMAQLLTLPDQSPERLDEILSRLLGVAELFELERLHPNVMAQSALTAAHTFCGLENREKALQMLELYVKVCEHFAPFTLHGDAFFDSIDPWLADFDLGNQAPRSEEVIKKSLIQNIEQNPALSILTDTPEFQTIVTKLKAILGGN